MALARKAYLGRYNASKANWINAFRAARCLMRAGGSPDPALSGIEWKAQRIVAYERASVDPLTIPMENRLIAHKLICEILLDE